MKLKVRVNQDKLFMASLRGILRNKLSGNIVISSFSNELIERYIISSQNLLRSSITLPYTNSNFQSRLLTTAKDNTPVGGHQLPPRTVPEEKLRFKIRTYIGIDSNIQNPLTPHGQNPAEFKVTMQVSAKDLNLSDVALDNLKEMVGPRFNEEKQELKLVCNRFYNRIENKRYLVYLLENLLLEARKTEQQVATD
mmetsp:Transcript_36235/g.47788  ORF Transcript_36235/g.47788 Transcript_36235/m.47788 type:complete len:195 (+) Transcript_36235:1-585(+)